MDSENFKVKYLSKSDSELNKIAASKDGYVLEARFAAIQILSERGISSEYEKSIFTEIEKLNQNTQETEVNKEKLTKKIAKNLNTLPVGKKRVWHLQNGNELQIRRLNDSRYQIRIEDHYRSIMAPVMICICKEDSDLKTYPFFHLMPILIGLFTAALFVVLQTTGYIDFKFMILAIILAISIPIVLQLIMAPVLYPILKDKFESTLGR